MMDRRNIIMSIALVAACVAVYGQVLGFDFINTYDDPLYVTDCPQVKAGLTSAGVVWAFITARAYYFHPLTWLSLMLDCQIYGVRPWGPHLTNLVIHILNTLLLFHVLAAMTRRSRPEGRGLEDHIWPSFLTAALFAVHPLGVESVAWISERKGVLSTFFWLLAMAAYLRYVEIPKAARYAAVVAFYTLALMAKPMAVTFPFVLLLLDYWPLKRLGDRGWRLEAGRVGWLILEKTPLFTLTIAISVATYIMQKGGGLVFDEKIPWAVRLSNTPMGYVFYLIKTFFPWDLAVYYPHPFAVRPLWQVGGALLLLGGVTVAAVCVSRKRPYLLVGWLWYVGTLVPVIQVVKVANFAYADRYTYIPLIGVFIMLSWGLADFGFWILDFGFLKGAGAMGRRILFAIAPCWLAALTAAGMLQTRHWRDSVALWTHAIEAAPENSLAHTNLGLALADSGKTEEAIEHYRRAIQLNPRFFSAFNNLGLAFAQQGRTSEAVAEYEKSLRAYPGYSVAHNNLGIALAGLGRTQEAVEHYRKAIELDPDFALVHNNLGLALAELGQTKEAVEHYRKAIQLDPGYAEAHGNLGLALAELGQPEEAVQHYREALRIDPNNIATLSNFANLLVVRGELDEAERLYRKALELDPNHPSPYYNLACLYSRQGKKEQAYPLLKKAVALDGSLRAEARKDPDFEALREDPEFGEIVNAAPPSPTLKR